MKIERKSAPDALWHWLRAHLPPSLVGKEIPSGYGYVFCIYPRGYRRNFMEWMFENMGDAVAQVSGTALELYHPQYFSDFDDLLRRFEAETGIVPTLRYWEGEKVPAC